MHKKLEQACPIGVLFARLRQKQKARPSHRNSEIFISQPNHLAHRIIWSGINTPFTLGVIRMFENVDNNSEKSVVCVKCLNVKIESF